MANSKPKSKRNRRRALRRLRGRAKAKAPGAAPGTLVHTGVAREGPVTITALDFDGTRIDEKTLPDAEACRALVAQPGITWINVDGLHDTALIEAIGTRFGIHKLVL